MVDNTTGAEGPIPTKEFTFIKDKSMLVVKVPTAYVGDYDKTYKIRVNATEGTLTDKSDFTVIIKNKVPKIISGVV